MTRLLSAGEEARVEGARGSRLPSSSASCGDRAEPPPAPPSYHERLLPLSLSTDLDPSLEVARTFSTPAMDARPDAAKTASPAGPPSYAAVAAAPAAPSAGGDGHAATPPRPSTPSRKRVSLLLTNSPTSSSAPGSPLASRFDNGAHDDGDEVTRSPVSGSRRGSGQPHEYTSLSALRKSNKGKAVDRGDRRNGWHLWSQEADAEGARAASVRGEASVNDAALGKDESEKAGKRKLSTLDMVRPLSLVSLIPGLLLPKRPNSVQVCCTDA
jgi:hypothetical protein